MEEKLHINSLAVHSGTRKDDAFGAINEPIYMTSNYRIPTDGTPVDWSGIHSTSISATAIRTRWSCRTGCAP